jgi:hypothetical protein
MIHRPSATHRFACCAAVVGLALAALGPSGCSRPSLQERLASPDPNQRSQAVVDMARSADRANLPALVECLEDDDPAVRFYAILALERMTGTRLGYSYAAPPAQRRVAYHAWRAYLVQNSDAPHRPNPPASTAAGSMEPAAPAAAASENETLHAPGG